jgi:hypothetical protein
MDSTYDILIDMPASPNLNQRKDEFRQRLYNYILANNGFDRTEKKCIVVPTIKFSFEEKNDVQANSALKNVVS